MGRILLGDRTFVERTQEPPEWPYPLETIDGTITFIGSDFARTRGWRTVHDNLDQTNMTEALFYLENGSPVFSKDTIRLDKRMYWVNDWWKPWLGPEVWPLYCQPGFGYEDFNEENTDPDVGPFKQQTIDDGCNLHRLIGEPFWTRKGQFQQIEAIDYFSRPDPSQINYKLTPHLIHKQVVASKSKTEQVAYITHQKHADLVWPNLFVHPLIISDALLERFPQTPFETNYLGVPTTIYALGFQASKVYGLFYDGFRVIEESIISGIGSAYYDRRVYVSDWLETPPPTIKGYTRGISEKFSWQV